MIISPQMETLMDVITGDDASVTGEDLVKAGKAAGRIDRRKLREMSNEELEKPGVLDAVMEGISDMIDRKEPGSRAKAFDLANRVD